MSHKRAPHRTQRVVVTGAAGFIGSHLCEALLRRGDDVVGIDNLTDYYSIDQKLANLSDALEMGLHFEQIDLAYVRLDEILRNVDVVFHLAGEPGDSHLGASASTYLERNLLATARLLEACLKTNPRRIIVASSSAIYGNVMHRPVKEHDRLRPTTPYAFTKAASEELLHAYDEHTRNASVSLRYFSVYGPRQRPDMLIARLIESVHRGEKTALDNAQLGFDAVYIDDAIAATIAAAERGPHSAYNIGSGVYTAVDDVIQLLGQISGHEPAVASPLPNPAVLESEGLRADLSLSNQKALYRRRSQETSGLIGFLRPPSAWADISLARRELGYQPRISLSDGVTRQFAASRNASPGAG